VYCIEDCVEPEGRKRSDRQENEVGGVSFRLGQKKRGGKTDQEGKGPPENAAREKPKGCKSESWREKNAVKRRPERHLEKGRDKVKKKRGKGSGRAVPESNPTKQ